MKQVALPPKDQRHVDRLGLLYFARPQNDLVLKTVDSPVLKRAGATQNEFEAGGYPVPTMGGEKTLRLSLLPILRRWLTKWPYFPEFTTLKQQWQQKRGKSYKTSHGQEILPGFTGQIFT